MQGVYIFIHGNKFTNCFCFYGMDISDGYLELVGDFILCKALKIK